MRFLFQEMLGLGIFDLSGVRLIWPPGFCLWRTVKYEDIYIRDYPSVPALTRGLEAYFLLLQSRAVPSEPGLRRYRRCTLLLRNRNLERPNPPYFSHFVVLTTGGTLDNGGTLAFGQGPQRRLGDVVRRRVNSTTFGAIPPSEPCSAGGVLTSAWTRRRCQTQLSSRIDVGLFF